ncbi:MAG: hypothetical protein UT66_C0023G0009 [candidate division CPR2 bacterium GW2011_GWC1_39_9]|nr:MAG: hypothetical protein UT66_C0023G0009 [candidate division CPR2 bacterium GW2011_GWC1_39_9]
MTTEYFESNESFHGRRDTIINQQQDKQRIDEEKRVRQKSIRASAVPEFTEILEEFARKAPERLRFFNATLGNQNNVFGIFNSRIWTKPATCIYFYDSYVGKVRGDQCGYRLYIDDRGDFYGEKGTFGSGYEKNDTTYWEYDGMLNLDKAARIMSVWFKHSTEYNDKQTLIKDFVALLDKCLIEGSKY